MQERKFYPWQLFFSVVCCFLNYIDRQMLSDNEAMMMVDIAELRVANFGRLMAIFLDLRL